MLSPLPVITPPVFLTGSISIALLNIRSVITKLPDINQDIILKFETWLTHDQNSQLFSDHQVIARSDCVTGNSMGGVIFAIHDAIQVAHMTNFPLSYILVEANTAIITLPNQNHFQVTLVYRSPSVFPLPHSYGWPYTGSKYAPAHAHT